MSQLSVPSSDLFDGGQSNINTPVGEATFWETLAEDDEISYTDAHLGPIAIIGFNPSSQIACGLQTIADPGIDVGFTLRYIARITIGGSVVGIPAAGISLALDFAGSQTPITSTPNFFSSLTGVFTLYEQPLSEAEVQIIRANGGWNSLYIVIAGGTGNIAVGADPNVDIDVAFIQLEAPNAASPDIEIESDAGFSFGGSNYFETLSDAGLEFDLTAPMIFNTVISDAGLEFNFAVLQFGNQVTSDAGLVFDTSAQHIVLSVDASGIYTFIDNQHYDDLYNRNTYPSEHAPYQIPTPQGKTGYFSG